MEKPEVYANRAEDCVRTGENETGQIYATLAVASAIEEFRTDVEFRHQQARSGR